MNTRRPCPLPVIATLLGVVACGPTLDEGADAPIATESNPSSDTETGLGTDVGDSGGLDTGIDALGPLDFAPSDGPGTIDWEQFPEFALPEQYLVGWHAPHLDRPDGAPLGRGITHLSQGGVSDEAAPNVPLDSRMVLWTGVAGIEGSPWREHKSPWGNDLTAFENRWESYYSIYASKFGEKDGTTPIVDIIVADIEHHLADDEDILALRSLDSTPPELAKLDDVGFVEQYHRDMAALYTEALEFAHDAEVANEVSSYGDAPVRRTWWEIDNRSWSEWTTDPSVKNELLGDWQHKGSDWVQHAGPFEQRLDRLSPSAYYFYDYSDGPDDTNDNHWSQGGQNIAYMLFQIEVNAAWSNKPQMVWQWMEYHGCCRSAGRDLPAELAHASAIFPFLAGATGVVVWNDDNGFDENKDYRAYEWYVYGLYRLARHQYVLEAPERYVGNGDAVTLFTEKVPIWRGIIRGNRLLVAAVNPYADDGESTDVPIEIDGELVTTLTVTGRQVALEGLQLVP